MLSTYAIGDVHGCLTALRTLLEKLPLKTNDQLIFLGDLVDRGPDSRGVLDLIQRLISERPVQLIRGNHEEMLVWARDDASLCKSWLMYGGRETLLSYGWDQSKKNWAGLIPEFHWRLLTTQLIDCVETEHDLLVHAAVDPDLPMAEQFWPESRWIKWNNPARHLSGKRVVCGHTHQTSGLPLQNANAICIDTWAYGQGWLTALLLESDQFFQANEQGEFRTGSLASATTTNSDPSVSAAPS